MSCCWGWARFWFNKLNFWAGNMLIILQDSVPGGCFWSKSLIFWWMLAKSPSFLSKMYEIWSKCSENISKKIKKNIKFHIHSRVRLCTIFNMAAIFRFLRSSVIRVNNVTGWQIWWRIQMVTEDYAKFSNDTEPAPLFSLNGLVRTLQ